MGQLSRTVVDRLPHARGVKTFPWVARASGGSVSFKLLENVAVNFVFAILVQKTGSHIFIGEGPWPLVLSVVFGSLATARLHRLKMAFERRSPSDPAWEAKHAKGSLTALAPDVVRSSTASRW